MCMYAVSAALTHTTQSIHRQLWTNKQMIIAPCADNIIRKKTEPLDIPARECPRRKQECQKACRRKAAGSGHLPPPDASRAKGNHALGTRAKALSRVHRCGALDSPRDAIRAALTTQAHPPHERPKYSFAIRLRRSCGWSAAHCSPSVFAVHARQVGASQHGGGPD